MGTDVWYRVEEDEIDDQCDALRKKLEAEQARTGGGPRTKNLKSHQVHELAKAKIDESEKGQLHPLTCPIFLIFSTVIHSRHDDIG